MIIFPVRIGRPTVRLISTFRVPSHLTSRTLRVSAFHLQPAFCLLVVRFVLGAGTLHRHGSPATAYTSNVHSPIKSNKKPPSSSTSPLPQCYTQLPAPTCHSRFRTHGHAPRFSSYGILDNTWIQSPHTTRRFPLQKFMCCVVLFDSTVATAFIKTSHSPSV